MEIVRTVADLRDRVAGWRRAGQTVALAPTMGALHEGHLSLIHVSLDHADRSVASIFVNPTQFGEGEDLAAYPRDEARDGAMLESAGCHLLFAPSVDEMYPEGFATEVRVRGLTGGLCGEKRPGHFDGVAQVVTKLLNQAQADVAVFGEKDWQQLVVVRRLTRDLDIPTRIVGAPIVREEDGLAMSSRNRYLDAQQRAVAAELNRALREAGRRIAAGEAVAGVLEGARSRLLDAGFESVDYIEVREATTLDPLTGWSEGNEARIFGAAKLGRARLIDNMAVG